ncbi:MAG: hypothetical protein HKM93_03750 [Desulfobacteraceae bacterium]|nr:hypothetical protein [Desulfobacteraceae bacterium]
MSILNDHMKSEEGAVMFIAILILAAVVIIGVTAINTSNVELKMAGNDALVKRVHYSADGLSNLGIELLEKNIRQAGFEPASPGTTFVEGNLEGDNLNFYLNPTYLSVAPCDNTNRDCWSPPGWVPGQPHGNLKFGGDPGLAPGSASQMARGYDGPGAGAAGGGVIIPYAIGSQWVGEKYANRTIGIEWRHVVGLFN